MDRISGSARIVLAPGSVLDYEQVHQYNFEIAAHDCETGNHAQRCVGTLLALHCVVLWQRVQTQRVVARWRRVVFVTALRWALMAWLSLSVLEPRCDAY